MKKSLLAIILAFAVTSVYAGGVATKICHDKVVKSKKVTACKMVKVHKKVEDTTKVPTKKK